MKFKGGRHAQVVVTSQNHAVQSNLAKSGETEPVYTCIKICPGWSHHKWTAQSFYRLLA